VTLSGFHLYRLYIDWLACEAMGLQSGKAVAAGERKTASGRLAAGLYHRFAILSVFLLFPFYIYIPIYKYMYSVLAGPAGYAGAYLAYPVDSPQRQRHRSRKAGRRRSDRWVTAK